MDQNDEIPERFWGEHVFLSTGALRNAADSTTRCAGQHDPDAEGLRQRTRVDVISRICFKYIRRKRGPESEIKWAAP